MRKTTEHLILFTYLLLACGGVQAGIEKIGDKPTPIGATVELGQDYVGDIEQKLTSDIADLRREVTKLSISIRSLSNDLSSIKNSFKDLRAKLDNFDLRLSNAVIGLDSLEMLRAAEISKKSLEITHEVFQTRYKDALNLFENADYDSAIAIFADLIAARPDDDLADNAQYWMGECYYGKKDYKRAVLEFEKVFTFVKSNKADDAQFKIGLSHLRMKDSSRARDEFQRLIEYYPDSEFVSLANKYLSRL